MAVPARRSGGTGAPPDELQSRSADVLVLGGGVIGLTCALELLREGRSVTVLERSRVGAAASHGNCGTLTPSLLPLPAPGVVARALKWMCAADSPLLIRPRLDPAFISWLLHFASHCTEAKFRAALRVKLPLLLQARARIEQLIKDEELDCEFSPGGHLQVFRREAEFTRAQKYLALTRELGLHTEVLDGAQARRAEPLLGESIIGALSNPGDAQLRPERYACELARAVRARGGTIQENTAVTGFRLEAGRLMAIATEQGEYGGRDVVLALGAWTPLLSRQLGLTLPVQPGKGYSITYENDESPAQRPKIPLVLKERAVCVTAWASGYRLGSTMEFAGYDPSLNRARLDALTRAAGEYLRAPPETRPAEEWTGWRPMTYDDLPVIGQAPGLSNLWLATGHGMLGVTLSALTAHLIAAMITGKNTSLDTEPFSPARFGR